MRLQTYKGKNMSDTILGTNSELFMSLLKDYIKYGVYFEADDGTYTNRRRYIGAGSRTSKSG